MNSPSVFITSRKIFFIIFWTLPWFCIWIIGRFILKIHPSIYTKQLWNILFLNDFTHTICMLCLRTIEFTWLGLFRVPYLFWRYWDEFCQNGFYSDLADLCFGSFVILGFIIDLTLDTSCRWPFLKNGLCHSF